MSNPNQTLYDILRRLHPTGPDGFEGLIAKLLESLIGRRFFLAKAGFQGGRDMSTESRYGNIIAVECKKYLENTKLKERELLGEIAQVSRIFPDLDLWVLVASREVDSTLQDSINYEAREHGFEAFIVDTIEPDSKKPSSLSALCAHASDIVLQFIQKNKPRTNLKTPKNTLATIKTQSGYQHVIQELKNTFSSSTIGYDNWRYQQNTWLLEQFRSGRKSYAAFKQYINVLDGKVLKIEREHVNKSLSNWFQSWQKDHAFLALVGEEGDGKTWATASWLAKELTTHDNFPSVIFLTSTAVSSTIGVQELLADTISLQLKEFNAEYWKKRISQWMQRPICGSPQIILVLDGINERADIDWQSLVKELTCYRITRRTLEHLKKDGLPNEILGILKSLQDDEFANQNDLLSELSKHIGEEQTSQYETLILKHVEESNTSHIAVILTCRSIPWKEYTVFLSELTINVLTVPPFDDDELTVALSRHSMTLSSIHSSLFPLIRTPRLFALMVKHQQVMIESDDIALERLLYEDWRHRTSKKSGIRLGHAEFHVLIKDLAEKSLSRSTLFSRRDVENLLPYDDRQAVQELISSGILLPDPIRKARYTVEPRRLIHGLGLLLKEEVHEALKSNQPVDECIAQLLEPHRDMDLKVKICGAAVVHALMDEQFSEKGTFVLVRTWLEGRNMDEKSQQSIIAYLPERPEICIQLVEYVWSEIHNNAFAQTLLMREFLKWCEHPKLQALLPAKLERWMGFLHPYGFINQRGRKQENSEKIRQEIESRFGTQLQPGPISFQGYDLTVIEDNWLLRLAKVALAIISHSQRRPFIKALVRWSLSRTLMGHLGEYELVSWVLKTAQEDLWESFRAEIDRLIALDNIVTKQAASRLLSCLGSQKAYQLQRILPDDLFPPHPLQEMYEQDPCMQGFYLWRREDYADCLQRKELAPYHIASKMKELALEPDLPVPSDLGERLKSLVGEDFSPDGFWMALGATSDDHQLNEVESALAAFAPDVLADIVRRIIRDAPNRSDMDLRQLSLKIEPNLLILRKEEQHAVEQAWRKLIANWDNLNESEQQAEDWLFPAILVGLSAEEQLQALLSRPDDALDLSQYKYLFRSLNPQHAEKFFQDPSNTNNPRKLQRILWFLFVNPDSISATAVKQITTFLEREETETRRFVLELIYRSHNEDAIQYVLSSSWAWNPEHRFEEDKWGSFLLSDFGQSLSYQEICARVHPVYLGYAVEKRGLMKEEVAQYAEYIHSIWQSIKEKRTTPTGNDWFAKKFQKHALEQVLVVRPDLVQTWLQAVYEDTEVSSRLIFLCRGFYEALLEVLFKNKPEEALKLLNRLQSPFPGIRFIDSHTGLLCSDSALFHRNNHPAIQNLWNDRLESCSNDLELFEFVLAFQQEGNISWLKQIIREGLDSPWHFNQARAIMLLGFLEDAESKVTLQEYCNVPQSWIKSVAEKALAAYQRNVWAKHWFQQFLEDDDNVKAWACYKLFLKCVDRRFLIWEPEFVNEESVKNMQIEERVKFLRLNQNELKKHIEANEKRRRETFLGEKVLKDKVWPWMNF